VIAAAETWLDGRSEIFWVQWASWIVWINPEFGRCITCFLPGRAKDLSAPSPTKITGSSFVGFVCFMKWRTGKKSRSVSTPRDGNRGLIQAVCHSSVLV
jgi:hypothetical protein